MNSPKSDNISSFVGNLALLLVRINVRYNLVQKTIDKSMKNLSCSIKFSFYIFEK